MVGTRRRPSPLRLKMLRDLKDGWKSFAAILLICMLSTTLYMGFDGTWRGMQKNFDAQIEDGNLSDIWVRGQLADNAARKIAEIPGVWRIQRRVTADAEADSLPGDPTIRLYMSEGMPEINRPILLAGAGFSAGRKNLCILQKRFADAQGLAVGDVFTVTVYGRRIDLAVSGIGVLPELMIFSRDGDIVTPAADYGYACVSPGTLGFLSYREIDVTLAPGADPTTIKREIQGVVDGDATTITPRADVVPIKSALEQIAQLRLIGLIVPIVFFLVAALITWTTMGRLVENQRLQIGTLFALGYGRGTLLFHYAEYGAVIALLGAAGGVVGARYGFAPLLLWFLQTVYAMPGVLPAMSTLSVAVIALGLVCVTGGSGILSAQNALHEAPASLLRPKPPGKSKNIFLERMPRVWTRLSFSGKMIARNMLRSPVRLFMGLVGTVGCTALMVVGFGLRDTVEFAKRNYYTNVLTYNARATLAMGTTEGYADSVARRAGADHWENQMIAAADAYLRGDWQTKALYVLEDGQALIRLTDESGSLASLPETGVAVTRKLAEDDGIRAGDTLLLHINGYRDASVEVRTILSLEMDQGLYISREALRRLDWLPYSPTSVLLKGDSLDLVQAADMDGVDRVRTRTQEYEDSNTQLKTLNLVVLLLIGFSGSLALVVYYNLGQLNYSERIRELATLKVLGFLPRETKRLVLRENIILSIIGLPFGLVAGVFLHRLVMAYALPSFIQFTQHIAPTSYALISIITVGFSMLVNRMLGGKIKSIDMVEALKSAE